ncbi:SRPBCC family protein [Micromonospora sp. NPDC048999]|uniref:SRPBCC family protein n=1 Tax=Micromonospora sp. NPDC048999 TaxID=3155391 RepID=UPI0033EA9F35
MLDRVSIENNTRPGLAVPVLVSLRVNAKPERVWRSLIDPEELAAWFWPRKLQPAATLEAKTGGSYRISAASPPMAVSGEYLELTRPQRLIMTWQWDGDEHTSTVTIDLVPARDGTDLQVVHDGLPAEAVEAHRTGWSDCLRRLPAHLAGTDAA